MARSKLLTAAALSSAIILASCAGKTVSDDTSATTTTGASTSPETTVETLVLETEEDITLDIEQVDVETMVEEGEELGVDMIGDTVYFDYDKSDIRAEYRDMLAAHAAYLVANSNKMVVLEGHADERGTREYNLGLGELRAKQVATYLQVKGVSASQIDVVSYGEEKPLAMGKSEAAYAENRRVQFQYK
jgi:peptidoglycan-associated lipoprotein